MSNGGEGTAFEPFSAAALNTYLLNGNQMGGLATFDFYSQYVELTAKMFGGFLNYNFNNATKQLNNNARYKRLRRSCITLVL